MLEDWLLIGAQEGLFITQLTSPRVPFIVAGLASVFHVSFFSRNFLLYFAFVGFWARKKFSSYWCWPTLEHFLLQALSDNQRTNQSGLDSFLCFAHSFRYLCVVFSTNRWKSVVLYIPGVNADIKLIRLQRCCICYVSSLYKMRIMITLLNAVSVLRYYPSLIVVIELCNVFASVSLKYSCSLRHR